MRELFRKIAGILNLSGRDAKVMIVSLLLAYGIWLIHNLTLNYTEVIKVPVTAHCDIEGHAASLPTLLLSSPDAALQVSA